MSTKEDFSAEEWAALKEAPALAGVYVLLAEPGGTMREGPAIAESYGEARERIWKVREPTNLIEAVIMDGPAFDQDRFGTIGDLKEDEIRSSALGRVGEAAAILRTKASPQDLSDYQAFVIGLATHVAESHKEGRTFGFGGTKISEAEQAAIDEIASALG